MKRLPYIAVLLIIFVAPGALLFAAPQAQEQRPIIAQPQPDAPVRGVVQLVGTATHPQFQRYELYYAPWPVPSDQSWIFIGPDAHYQQQPLGLLGTWDSRAVPDGTYVLRVRVVKQDGNYLDSDPLRVLVANTRPPDTPTPEVTETPTSPPTSLPPTATIVVAVPTVEIPTAQPTATPDAAQPTSVPILSPAEQTNAASPASAISGGRILGVAEKTALYTIGVFAATGVFFGVKALLFWLWQRLRP